MISMEKKVAVITGARRGIGLGIAQELGLEGYYVVLSAFSKHAEEALATMKELGLSDYEYMQCDVSDSKAREELVKAVCKKHGRLDVLVNCAGVAPKERCDLLETSEESYDFVLDTNAKSTFFMCQLAANAMIAFQEKGTIQDYSPRIINISSVSAYTVSINRGEYCVSKAAISMITQLFALRLAECGIPVFEVRPGIIQTDMTAAVTAQYEKRIAEGLTPIRRYGQSKDVADCVVAACSGKIDFSAGQVLNADGGFSIRSL